MYCKKLSLSESLTVEVIRMLPLPEHCHCCDAPVLLTRVNSFALNDSMGSAISPAVASTSMCRSTATCMPAKMVSSGM